VIQGVKIDQTKDRTSRIVVMMLDSMARKKAKAALKKTWHIFYTYKQDQIERRNKMKRLLDYFRKYQMFHGMRKYS